MYTVEEKAIRFIQIKEINSVLCEHCLYFGRRQQKEELERLWVKQTPDPSFSQNNGSFVGYDALNTYYADSELRRKARYDKILAETEPEFAEQPDDLRYGTLTLSLQTLSTPCIEIAEDGQTAKGLWTVSAQVTAMDNGHPVGLWVYGKLGADLAWEEGHFRIWHMQVCTDFLTPAGKPFDPAYGQRVYPAGLGIDEEPTAPGALYSWYCENRVPANVPAMPKMYRTFSETFSYG